MDVPTRHSTETSWYGNGLAAGARGQRGQNGDGIIPQELDRAVRHEEVRPARMQTPEMVAVFLVGIVEVAGAELVARSQHVVVFVRAQSNIGGAEIGVVAAAGKPPAIVEAGRGRTLANKQ